MKLDKTEIDRLADVIRKNTDFLVHMQLAHSIREFEKYCGSPIEALFGAAFHFAGNAINFTIARGKLIYLNDPARSKPSLLPAQWELVPQFSFEKYRIDFAVFTGDLPYPIFIECDGHDFHERTKEQAAHDREKDRRIQAAGIPILRFTGSQLHADTINCAIEVYTFILERIQRKKSA